MKEYIEREAAVAFLENMAASRYLIRGARMDGGKR